VLFVHVPPGSLRFSQPDINMAPLGVSDRNPRKLNLQPTVYSSLILVYLASLISKFHSTSPLRSNCPIPTSPRSRDFFPFLIPRSRVLNLGNNQITRSNHRQLIHCNRNIFPQHHRLHRNPSVLLERIDRRRAAPRCNLARLVEVRARDVVRAEDVLLGSWTQSVGGGKG
jgi:hypothetical protein